MSFLPKFSAARRLSRLFPLAVATFTLDAQQAPVPLESVVVTAARSPQSAQHVAVSVRTFDGEALRSAPSVTLDGALRSVPGFSLFRRSDSLSANPTAQGVSLRGLGPSGASRSLVLVDGVPLNDPFGGWIPWSLVPRESLAGAELVRGGGATAWGNAALGGVVQLLTTPVRGASARLAASTGSFATHSAEVGVTRPVRAGAVQLLGRFFETEGFSLVAPERRGTIDVPAASRHRWLTARWQTPIGENLQATLTARTFAESRGNGTPYQRNASRANSASVTVDGQPGANFSWQATAYGQAQSFQSTFSSVNAARTAETPASDQYAVPATAIGGAWTGAWKNSHGSRTSAGIDFRDVRGETRENYNYAGGTFTRQRLAGGRQNVAGLFALREQSLGDSVTANVGVRCDAWNETDGHRRETDRATATALRNDVYADRDGLELSPSAGLVWRTSDTILVRAAAQQAFRRPTLNELYRPFRQGSTVTEANAALKTERVSSGELGVEWSAGPKWVLGATGFWSELHDAVGNVTIARGPGTFPIVGTLGVGGIGRQRLNLDRTQVRGGEFSATWKVNAGTTIRAEAIVESALVRRADAAPALAGKRLAQVPRHSASVSGAWDAPLGFKFTPRIRWVGAQFEDDENKLRLGEVVIGDIGITRACACGWEIFLNAENVGNVRIETGRSADGVVNTGTPRLLMGGVRGAW